MFANIVSVGCDTLLVYNRGAELPPEIFAPQCVDVETQGGYFMKEKECISQTEIPLAEIRLQLNYARTVGNDIHNVFADSTPDANRILLEYRNIQTKLSMLLDFIFQADLWCKTIEDLAE